MERCRPASALGVAQECARAERARTASFPSPLTSVTISSVVATSGGLGAKRLYLLGEFPESRSHIAMLLFVTKNGLAEGVFIELKGQLIRAVSLWLRYPDPA
jgi:hypothetical protein